MTGRDKIDSKFIDKIIMKHMRINNRALHRNLYIEVEGRNRDIRREAIGRRIKALCSQGKIAQIRMLGGEPQYGLVEHGED